MAEIDYQMALLLQYKFEQEHKCKENTNSDHQLALELQQQFKAELEVDRPGNNLVYKAPTASNSGRCLVDPSWEVIDPTPDIHVLFMAFNKRFFWNTLGLVMVSWSKRMTTCAGVCSYQGRGGLCSITLSEPLLKLRPRKDLVETLLHEMIHAYLFVTENNRDRDGHGPEFHKHMYRINAEAGTNITVYHDFHDEVRLYQQHWWRCDGACQQRKPYFGMVRRAMNRPPGPNDRWWAEHMRTCGGTFIKVKSPENSAKVTKKKEQPKLTNPKNDIRNYITSTNKENLSQPKVHTVQNTTGGVLNVSKVIPSETNSIVGFTNLNGGAKNPKRPAVKGAVKNAGSSTFVITANTTSVPKKPSTSSISDIQPFSGTGRLLGTPISSSPNNTDYSVVRDHWLKKFDNNPPQSLAKRLGDAHSSTNAHKISKLINCDRVTCPVCNNKFKPEDLNGHLDACLQSSDEEKACHLCNDNVSVIDFEKHLSDCAVRAFSGDFENVIDLTNCNKEETKPCPVCKKSVLSKDYGLHVQNCALSKFDEYAVEYHIKQPNHTSCLACGKDILRNDLETHLEDCMSMSNVFDTTHVPIEDDTHDKDKQSPVNSCNCPFCLKLVLENEMQGHLDHCLEAKDVLSNSDFKDEYFD